MHFELAVFLLYTFSRLFIIWVFFFVRQLYGASVKQQTVDTISMHRIRLSTKRRLTAFMCRNTYWARTCVYIHILWNVFLFGWFEPRLAYTRDVKKWNSLVRLALYFLKAITSFTLQSINYRQLFIYACTEIISNSIFCDFFNSRIAHVWIYINSISIYTKAMFIQFDTGVRNRITFFRSFHSFIAAIWFLLSKLISVLYQFMTTVKWTSNCFRSSESELLSHSIEFRSNLI